MQASDHALPTPRKATVQVIVSVPRDNAPTVFDKQQYTATISETTELNAKVKEVKARDANLKVRACL